MNNHRCMSQKSLITIRKWLSEAGDCPTDSFYIPYSKLGLKKVNKRKRYNKEKDLFKTLSIIDWFYEFVKKIFTIYDENQWKSSDQAIDDTPISIKTCSICQFENVEPELDTVQTILKSSKSDSYSKMNTKKMITTATSSSNLNNFPSILLRSSKSTQTQSYDKERSSTVYPLYCFSVKDGQIMPLQLSSPSSSAIIPIVKDSSPLCINNEKSKYSAPGHSPKSPLTTDIYSHSSYRPIVASVTSSQSNTISLQTTHNPILDDVSSKIPRPLSSLHDTRISHFDKRNCLIECSHLSNTGKRDTSNFHHSSNTPEIVFAESTCQLIKQAWLSSTLD